MRGSLWIENTRGRDGAGALADSVGAFLAVCAIGVLAGVAGAHLRLHLGLAGHKAVLLMAPVVAARFVFRSMAGATGGMAAAALASMAAGGQVTAESTHLPFAAAAGCALDAAIGLAERRQLAAPWVLALAGAAGLAANLVLLAERLLTPLLQSHAFLGVSGLGGRALSYALFGLLAGLTGAGIGQVIRRRRAGAMRLKR
jgi:hypothetical protein